MESYDVVVIGAGPGGYTAAIHATHQGAKVALIEKENEGGLCLNFGCIPSKILLKDAEIYREAEQRFASEKFGGDIYPNYSKIVDSSRDKIIQMRKGLKSLIERNKVAIIKGLASFDAKDLIKIKLENAKEEVIKAGKGTIVATGTQPMELKECKIDQKSIITSGTALNLRDLPESIVIIGGGAIGCEMATLFNSFGTKVIVIELQSQLLPGTDPDIAKALLASFKKSGIEVKLSAKIAKCEPVDTNDAVHTTLESGENISTKKVLVAVGVKNYQTLNLDKLGVKFHKSFILVDPAAYRTALDTVYAVGDAIRFNASPDTPHPLLAHVAAMEGELAADYILNGKPKHAINYERVPATIFTHPEIGIVGLTEQVAKEKLPEHDIVSVAVKDMFFGLNIALEKTNGLTKLIIDKTNHGEILGAHIIGEHATDRIATLAEAMQAEESAFSMARQMIAHPTFSEPLRELLMTMNKSAIHIPLVMQK